MGRLFIWAGILLAVGGLSWVLFGDQDPEGPAYGPMADYDGDEEALVDGPGLVGGGGTGALAEVAVADGKAFIKGIVLSKEGTPLAGIRLAAHAHRKGERASNRNQSAAALVAFEPPQDVSMPVAARATSGADGRFTIRGLEKDRSFTVVAEVEAPRLATRQQWTARVTPQAPLRIFIGEGSPLRVRIVDSSGAGLAGYVSARSGSAIASKPWHASFWSQSALKTGADGRLTLPAVPNGTVTFTVSIPGRGTRSGIIVDTPSEEEVPLAFDEPDGASLEGRVTDTSGAPIAGVKVTVNTGPDQSSIQRTSVTRAAVSAEDGTFRASGLVPGIVHNVNAYAEGFIPSGALAGQMPLSKGKTSRLDITLVRGATIEGRVVDTQGNPVAGAEVAATRMGQSMQGWFATLSSTVSDGEGRFKLVDVAMGSGLVQARMEGYYMPPSEAGASNPYPWMQNAMQGTPFEAKSEGESLTGKEIVLAKGTDVTGTVVDEQDQPLAGVTVSAIKGNRQWSPGLANQGAASAQTDGEGRFTFVGIEPDQTWKLSVLSETHLTEKPVDVVVPKEGALAEEPKLVAKVGATVSGVVTETGAGPVAGIAVRVNGATQEHAVTDAEGAFTLAGLKPGTWSVAVSGVTPLPEGASEKVTLEWGKPIEDIKLTLPLLHVIRGTVEDEDGKPVAGISVRAVSKSKSSNAGSRGRPGRRGNATKYTTSNAAGAFEFRGLLEGEYTLWAVSTKEDNVSTGTMDVRLVLTPVDRIMVEGRIFDSQDRPVARGHVRIWTGPSGKRRSSVNAPITGGYFSARVTTKESSVDAEVTAAYDAAGRGLNFVKKREKDVSLSGSIELRLDEGMTVSGKVSDAGGGALAGMQVRINKKGNRNFNYWGNNNSGTSGSARSGEDGSWVVKGLKPGDYVAELTPGGDWMTPEPTPVRAGDEGIHIKLKKGTTIEGRILTPQGTPLPGANVWLAETANSKKSRGVDKQGNDWMSGMRLRTKAGADGSFVVKGLPEEAIYNVTASGNGPSQPYISETLNDVGAGTKTVELKLSEGVLIEGEVRGPDGEIVRNGWIYANPVDKKSGLKGANVHLNGQSSSFKIGPLLPGRYKLQVQVHGGGYAAPAPIEADAPSKGIVFEVKRAASIRGTLSGNDVKGFTIMYGAKGNMQSGRVAEDGSWTVSNARHAVGTIYAYRRGDDRYAVLENAEPGKGPYNLTLMVGASITGRLEGWDSSMAKPNVYCMADGRWIQGTVQDDGSFVITGLPPGKYTVQGWVQKGRIEARKEVDAGASGISLKVTMNE